MYQHTSFVTIIRKQCIRRYSSAGVQRMILSPGLHQYSSCEITCFFASVSFQPLIESSDRLKSHLHISYLMK